MLSLIVYVVGISVAGILSSTGSEIVPEGNGKAVIIIDKDMLDPTNLKKISEMASDKQIPYTRPCECEDQECKCCAGIQIIGFGFNRSACTVLTYDADDRSVNMKILLNEENIFENRFSTLNRQVCVPVVPVTLVGAVDVCVRMYDMTIVEERLHGCLAMFARVARYPVMTLQFNCMEMGRGGVGISRPIGGNYSQSVLYPGDGNADDAEINVFDIFSKNDGSKPVHPNK